MAVDREEVLCLCEEAEPIALENSSCIIRTGHTDDDDDDDDDEEDEDEDIIDGEHVVELNSGGLGKLSRFKLSVEEKFCRPHQSRGALGTLRACLTSRPCTVCLYLFLVLIFLCSFISLLVISFLVAAPYVKATRFLRTRCTCVDVNYHPEEERCSCGKGCSSRYPCLRLTVNFTTTDNAYSSAVLANDETDLWKKCTYYPHCRTSRTENEESVIQYELKYGRSHKTFECFYNPGNPLEVIRTRHFHLFHVVHGLLWTCLLFVVSSIGLLLLFRWRGCDLV